MIHQDASFSSRVTDAVARLERRTDAEVIVVAAERSGTYRDLAWMGGMIGCLLVLALILFLPHNFHPVAILIDLVLFGPLLAWILDDRRIMRYLAPAARRSAQVRSAAESEFVREAVHGTPNRSGILVYISALEGRVEVIPDLGLAGRMAPGEQIGVLEAFAHDDLEGFLRGLDALGELLARAAPHAGEASDAVNLPDTPRIRG